MRVVYREWERERERERTCVKENFEFIYSLFQMNFSYRSLCHVGKVSWGLVKWTAPCAGGTTTNFSFSLLVPLRDTWMIMKTNRTDSERKTKQKTHHTTVQYKNSHVVFYKNVQKIFTFPSPWRCVTSVQKDGFLTRTTASSPSTLKEGVVYYLSKVALHFSFRLHVPSQPELRFQFQKHSATLARHCSLTQSLDNQTNRLMS